MFSIMNHAIHQVLIHFAGIAQNPTKGVLFWRIELFCVTLCWRFSSCVYLYVLMENDIRSVSEPISNSQSSRISMNCRVVNLDVTQEVPQEHGQQLSDDGIQPVETDVCEKLEEAGRDCENLCCWGRKYALYQIMAVRKCHAAESVSITSWCHKKQCSFSFSI